jgi:hypothetical protein
LGVGGCVVIASSEGCDILFFFVEGKWVGAIVLVGTAYRSEEIVCFRTEL